MVKTYKDETYWKYKLRDKKIKEKQREKDLLNPDVSFEEYMDKHEKPSEFDRFTDRLLQEQTHEVKIVEDFSDLDAENVSDDIAENTQDTTTLLEKYIDELDVDLDKKRLKNTMKALYLEACDLEI